MTQKEALNILKMGHNVYLTGQAGSGKTHVLNEYIAYLKERDVAVGVTASTGIAATHIGGMTIHSWSGLGIKRFLSDVDLDAMQQKQYLWKRLDKTQVLVIDEVSMLHPDMLDMVDSVCRAFKRTQKPFGGMQVVLSGDFFQLPPITRGGERTLFANSATAWQNASVRVCYLTEQFRQDDSVLSQVLNEMRSGSVSENALGVLRSRYKKEIIGDVRPTLLYTHNADVDTLNSAELAKLPGEDHVFKMTSSGRASMTDALKKSVLAPETLKLKEGAIVMFVKNNFEAGYVNGTLGKVEDFDEFDGSPIVRTLSGKKISVTAMEWTVEEDGKALAQVKQLPLRLAWAITIHKSQGMSMDAAEIDLSKSFVPGQGYVALSRLRSVNGLKLNGLNDMALAVNREVLSFDGHLCTQSEMHREEVAQVALADLEKTHEAFIVKAGGTVDEKEIMKNRKKVGEEKTVEKKKSTYETTRELLARKLSLEDMATERGLTIGTILSHLEKLATDGAELHIEHLQPKDKVGLLKIQLAFEKSKGDKLTPVHRALGGEFTFEELRLARLFLGVK